VEFISDRMDIYNIKRSLVQYYCSDYERPCENKSDDVRDNFNKELGSVSDHFTRYSLKMFWMFSMRR
jgi:hypothetical protein